MRDNVSERIEKNRQQHKSRCAIRRQEIDSIHLLFSSHVRACCIHTSAELSELTFESMHMPESRWAKLGPAYLGCKISFTYAPEEGRSIVFFCACI
jgi:hypothetical protein